MIFNLLTINFILATLSNYIYMDKIYIIFLIFLGTKLFIDIFINNKSNFRFNKKNIIIITTTIILLFAGNIFESSSIYTLLRNILIIYNVTLIFIILSMYPKKYYENFIVQLRNIAFVLAIFSIFENIYKINLTYQFIIDPVQKQYLIQSLLVPDYRVTSIFAHGIVYGNFLICAFFIGQYYKFNNKFIRYIYNIIIITNIYLTRSRSIWIAFVVMSFFLLISQINRKNKTFKKSIYVKITLFIAISIIIMSFFSSEINHLLRSIIDRFYEMNTTLGEASKIQRLGTISLIFNKIFSGNIFELLLGHGYGAVNNVMLNNTVYISNFSTTDNQYISILYDFGLISIIIYILFLLKKIVVLIKNNSDKLYKTNILLLIGNSVAMFFYTMFSWKGIFNLFLCSTIYLIVYTNKNNKEKSNES